jgi:hypothetical protein
MRLHDGMAAGKLEKELDLQVVLVCSGAHTKISRTMP